MSTKIISNNLEIGPKENSLEQETPARWHYVAMAVGVLVLGIGGFGVTGLLYSHGMIEVPSWLAHMIGTVGNTPQFWSLWVISVGGISLGAILVCVSMREGCREKIVQPEENEQINKEKYQDALMNECKKTYISLENLQKCVQKGARLTTPGPDGITPLQILANNHSSDMSSIWRICIEGPNLLEEEPNLLELVWKLWFDATRNAKWTRELNWRYRLENLSKVKKLSPEQSIQIWKDFLALPESAFYMRDSSSEVFGYLLDMMPSISMKDATGNTLLHDLCKEEKIRMPFINEVIQKEPSALTVPNHENITPLHLILQKKIEIKDVLEISKLLPKELLMFPDSRGITLFYLLVDWYISRLESEQYIDFAYKIFFDKKKDEGVFIENNELCRSCIMRLLALKPSYDNYEGREKLIPFLKNGVNTPDAKGEKPIDTVLKNYSQFSASTLDLLLNNGADLFADADTNTFHKILDKYPNPDLLYRLIPKGTKEQLNEKKGDQSFAERVFQLGLNDKTYSDTWTQCYSSIVTQGISCSKDGILHDMLDKIRDLKLQPHQRWHFFSMLSATISNLKSEDLHITNQNQQTVFQRVFYNSCISDSYTCLINLIQDKNFPVNALDSQSRTALHLVCQIDAELIDSPMLSDLIKALLAKGASPTAQDSDGNTPLHLYMQHSLVVKSCEKLLQKGYTIQNNKGKTPLHLWVANSKENMGLLAIIEFPQFSSSEEESVYLQKDKKGNNALHIACIYNKHYFISEFRKRKKDLFDKCAEGISNEWLVEKDPCIKSRNCNGIFMHPEHLKTLGLEENATIPDVTEAFKQRALETHPDKNPNKEKADEEFKKVKLAHDYLLNGT